MQRVHHTRGRLPSRSDGDCPVIDHLLAGGARGHRALLEDRPVPEPQVEWIVIRQTHLVLRARRQVNRRQGRIERLAVGCETRRTQAAPGMKDLPGKLRRIDDPVHPDRDRRRPAILPQSRSASPSPGPPPRTATPTPHSPGCRRVGLRHEVDRPGIQELPADVVVTVRSAHREVVDAVPVHVTRARDRRARVLLYLRTDQQLTRDRPVRRSHTSMMSDTGPRIPSIRNTAPASLSAGKPSGIEKRRAQHDVIEAVARDVAHALNREAQLRRPAHPRATARPKPRDRRRTRR